MLVVGGGQAGLCIAARLKQLDVDTLVVDRMARIGDNWRKRYHSLTLHNQVQVNHLPYMPFPPNWPTYIPKDMLANWFESYVDGMELNFWTGTEFASGSYDEKRRPLDRDACAATAASASCIPAMWCSPTACPASPTFPRSPASRISPARSCIPAGYDDGENWKGKSASCSAPAISGHDIAQDLHSSGVDATLVQRSSTLVVSIEPSAQLVYTPYNDGTLDDNDLIAVSIPLKLARKSHALTCDRSKALDTELLDGLRAIGFKLDFGEDNTGWQFKYLTRGGGYYFNVGCSDLLIRREIALKQFADIDDASRPKARR